MNKLRVELDEKSFAGVVLLVIAAIVSLGTLMIGCGAKNGSQSELEIAQEDLSNAVDICANNKNYYVAAMDKILLYEEDGTPGEVFTFPERQIVQVAYGDALYALDAQNQSILKLDKKGKVDGEYKLEFEVANLVDFEAVDSSVYLSIWMQEEDEHKEYIWILPWKEQKMEKMLSYASTLAAKEQDMLYTYRNGRVTTYQSSERKEKKGNNEGYVLATGTYLTSFCVDSHNKYYYCTDQRVVKEESGETEYLHRLDSDYEVIAECGDTLLLLKRYERLTLVTKQPYKTDFEKTLMLYGVGTEFEFPDGTKRDLRVELEEKYGATVERTSDIGMNQETFLTNLMSGADKYDLYRFNGNNEQAFHYIENHAYVDLSENKDIVEELNQWYTPFVEGCTYQGEIFGIPGGSSIEVLYCNVGDFPQLVKEDLSTWDGFLDAIEKYDADVQFNKIRLRSVLLSQYQATYCDTLNGEYEFDTEAFRKVLQLLRRIEGMDIKYYQKEGGSELFENHEIFQLGSERAYIETGIEFLPLPSIHGEKSISPLKIGYNVINPNSSQTELAMNFLSLSAECGFYSRKDTAEEYPLLADIYENHAKCVFGIDVDYGEALEGYVKGTMTEDEAIREITERTERKLNQ